jgi:hypothetical protein
MASEHTPAPLAAAHHQPLDPDEDDGLINQQGCGKVYLLLEECLGMHDRDWRKCQAEVRASGFPLSLDTDSSTLWLAHAGESLQTVLC